MVETRNYYVTLHIKEGSSYFEEANKKVELIKTNKIGSAVKPVAQMMAQSDMLRAILPTIISIDGKNVEFTKMAKYYFDSLSFNIPELGYEMNVGFHYDLGDASMRKNIEELEAQISKEKTKGEKEVNFKFHDSVALADYVEKNIDLNLKYRYGTAIDPFQFILHQYCLVYADVANTKAEVNKSNNIRFYLYDQEQAQREEAHKLSLMKEAMNVGVKVLDDKEMIDNILITLGEDIYSLSPIAKQARIKQLSDNRPADLIKAYNDKKLIAKATIERMIHNGILRRLLGTTAIVDDEQPDVVIGHSLDEAIVYFENPKHQSQVGAFTIRLKEREAGIPKK